jgi:Domain of unknown function (DUF4260)
MVALAGSLNAYHLLGGSWAISALLFLTLYLSMSRSGARRCNAGHSHPGPLLAVGLLVFSVLSLLPVIAIWTQHIGFDRLLGYGLKYPYVFRATHFGWVWSLRSRS